MYKVEEMQYDSEEDKLFHKLYKEKKEGLMRRYDEHMGQENPYGISKQELRQEFLNLLYYETQALEQYKEEEGGVFWDANVKKDTYYYFNKAALKFSFNVVKAFIEQETTRDRGCLKSMPRIQDSHPYYEEELGFFESPIEKKIEYLAVRKAYEDQLEEIKLQNKPIGHITPDMEITTSNKKKASTPIPKQLYW